MAIQQTQTQHSPSPSANQRTQQQDSWKTFRVFLDRFPVFHTSVALLGNLSFFIGSIFFLWESLKRAGVWLFIVGAFGMLLGSIGSGIVQYERRKRNGNTASRPAPQH